MVNIDIEKIKMKNYFRINNLSLNKILNGLFKKRIKRMTYLGVYELKQMPEYRFKLLKFNVILEDYNNYTVFVKLIDKYRVKESLFCYWFFCEQNYSINTKFFAPKTSVLNEKNKSYEIKYEFQLLKKNNKIWKSSFVDIINLNQYSIEINNINGIKKCLFVGVL